MMRWKFCGSHLPEGEIVFFAQVIMVYIVIIACLVNLSIGNGEGKLWTALLSVCLGFLLPNPKLKKTHMLGKIGSTENEIPNMDGHISTDNI